MLRELDPAATDRLSIGFVKRAHIFLTGYNLWTTLGTGDERLVEEKMILLELEQSFQARDPKAIDPLMACYSTSATDLEAWRMFMFTLEEIIVKHSGEIVPYYPKCSSFDAALYSNMIKGVFERPSMYFGSASLTYFTLFIKGLCEAERRHADNLTIGNQWRSFDAWRKKVSDSYPNCEWSGAKLLEANFDEARAFDILKNDYNLWLSS